MYKGRRSFPLLVLRIVGSRDGWFEGGFESSEGDGDGEPEVVSLVALLLVLFALSLSARSNNPILLQNGSSLSPSPSSSSCSSGSISPPNQAKSPKVLTTSLSISRSNLSSFNSGPELGSEEEEGGGRASRRVESSAMKEV